MTLITHGAKLRIYLRCARPPPFHIQTRAVHLNYAAKTRDHATNHKIKAYSPFTKYADPKDVELGLWTKRGGIQRMSLAHALEKELGPGKLLVPHAELENDKFIFGKNGLSWYTVKELQTEYTFRYHDLKGKGAKEVQLTQDVPALHFWEVMSKAWEWIDSQVRVEFHIRPKKKFGKDKRQEFTDAVNNAHALHLRADVLLSALPRTSAHIIRPLSDWQTRICWVTVKTNLQKKAEIKKLVDKEHLKLKKQIKIHDELLERGIALPPEEERKRMKDEVKAKEDFGAFIRQREAMFDRINMEYPLICPIVRRVAPHYAPADQLLYLACNIAWKIPRIRDLFSRSPIVYQKIRATITIDETKESVQARIKKMLDKEVKNPEVPTPLPNYRPLGAPLTHPFLLGTKKFNPNEQCCFRCGKVPCGEDHIMKHCGEKNMLSCPAPPSEWLPKWESVLLRDWIFAKKESLEERVGNSDWVDQNELHQYASLPKSNSTFKPKYSIPTIPAHSVLANTIPAHSENKESVQSPVPIEATPKADVLDLAKKDGSIDLDALRGSLKKDSLLADHNVVRRLPSRGNPDTVAFPFKRLKVNDSPTDSSSDRSNNREARQSPPPMDPNVRTFRDELSSNQSHNLETISEEDEPILPFIRKQAAFNLDAFTKPKPGGIARPVFTEKGEWLDAKRAAKPANRGSFRNFNFASDGTKEAEVNKGNAPQSSKEPAKSFLGPVAMDDLNHLKCQETFAQREIIKEETWKVNHWEKRYADMQKGNALLSEQLRARQEVWSMPPQDVNEALPHLIESRREDGTQHETHGSIHRSYENSRGLTPPEMVKPRTLGAMTAEAMRERIEAIREENNKVRRRHNGVTRSLVRSHGDLPGPSYTGVGNIRKKNFGKKWGRGVH